MNNSSSDIIMPGAIYRDVTESTDSRFNSRGLTRVKRFSISSHLIPEAGGLVFASQL